MKKLLLSLVLIGGLLALAYQIRPVRQTVVAIVNTPNYINEAGKTIANRVSMPDGFEHIKVDSNSFQFYIRHQNLKPFGSKVINYDGEPYFYQLGHVGVLDVDVPSNGLQQCADALIRLRSEYLWNTNQKDKIGFEFTSGDYCSWKTYAEGYRPKINGNDVRFLKTAQANHSKANFYNYLNLIYTYSGTMSLNNELETVSSIEDLQIGDMLIVGGFPGHVVMIADIAESDENDRLFLLIQGNTPAQSIHLLKNLENPSISPWYKLAINSEIYVPGFTFANSKFVRFK
ncbi:DUF4846 domain-containing protein [Winogradskyella maritima]|uniref:DUF4846 domain-containing protein n=1 Tax=Winogradskyella maritima TaxID=1517766 RepID=A0ABV8AG39_9FLAO|nr:DUF4846 domain-containing protein [Winogradskyella maritima]